RGAGDEQQHCDHGQRDPQPAARWWRRGLAVDAEFVEQLCVRIHRGPGRREAGSVTATAARTKWPEVTSCVIRACLRLVTTSVDGLVPPNVPGVPECRARAATAGLGYVPGTPLSPDGCHVIDLTTATAASRLARLSSKPSCDPGEVDGRQGART